jgi:UDP:flavonoid glycosyltransferase YjiC (YdhE family)
MKGVSRVYISLYGVGLGHASRMLPVANALANTGMEVRFSAFGDAVKYVQMHGFECYDVPPVEFAWSVDRGFSIKNSITKLPENLMHFVEQCGSEGRNIAHFDPDVVLSDTRLSSVLIAKQTLGLPCITILNQIKLLLSPRLREFRVARLFERAIAELLGAFWATSDSLLIPDLPPPYTLSEQNLWSVGSVSDSLEYIGFMAPKPKVNDEYVDKVSKLLGFNRKKPVVFAHISGPTETKTVMLKRIIESLQNTDIQFVASEGIPKGDTVPRKIGNGWYFEWCPVRDEIFAMSNLIIMRGGHSTLAHAIRYGKPVLTIPIENHGEQLGNAEKVQKVGMGLMLNQKDLKPEDVTAAVQRLLADPSFTSKANMLRDISNSMDGVEGIVQKVKSYL